ncbi:hypothetical protein EYV94_27945 [Puteibacter caeruleilacunae]|nr:hypothetical protein EYV94_27945 [Puteibacter caeruleilacunae]
MKRCVICVWILFLTVIASAQQIGQSPIYYQNNKVGIGNSEPVSVLDVNGGIAFDGVRMKRYYWGPLPKSVDKFLFQTNSLYNGATAMIEVVFYEGHLRVFKKFNVMINNSGGVNQCKIYTCDGNRADIGLELRYENRLDRPSVTEFYIRRVADVMWGQCALIKGYGINFGSHVGLSSTPTIDKLQQAINVSANGSVGIGTTSPDYLLDVNGTMRAKEVKVNLNEGPDYVFEDDYDLKSLEEVDRFVKERKHLPDVPSAKQMEEEGVGLAEMNKLLLQKVEELTLYTIKQEDKIKTMENQLSQTNELLKTCMEKLESLSKLNEKNK